ncbi:hypothetical protein HY489_05600 [Candidatus Woesearchaeota archaeon]|nr:hypothetical protein [Candidatus Woesearchaeota archaeon]
MKEKVIAAAKEAEQWISEANLSPEFKQKAYEVMFNFLLAQGVSPKKISIPATVSEPITDAPHNTFPEFFMGHNCETNAEIITAMAYFHGLREPDKRVSVKDLETYFALIKPKSANVSRDAKTAVMNAWLKPAEKKDSSSAWELIPLGKQHIESLRKNED